MARIRTIKPEFCVSEQLAECSTNARLLFILMWCHCDDNGIHPSSMKSLKMACFPGDDFTTSDIRSMVDELIKQKLLREYEVNSEAYLIVTGWNRHQKIDRPNPKYPLPIEEDSTSIRRINDDQSTSDHPRKGKEGKGRERNGEENTPKPPKGADPRVVEVVSYLNAKAGRDFGTDSKWHELNARLKEGATVDECKLVIDFKSDEWGKSDLARNINPTTLFRSGNWIRYLPDARLWQKNGHRLNGAQKTLQESLQENLEAIGLGRQ